MGCGGVRRPVTVTVLFTRIIDWMDPRPGRDDETAERRRAVHDRLVFRAVELCQGRVVKTLGDGVMAVFRSASDAVDAAATAQRGVARHNRWDGEEAALEVGMGLACGDVVLEDTDCFGTPVVEAAGLCGAAAGGQILASELVSAVAGGGPRFVAGATHHLQDLPAPVASVVVEWEPEGGVGPPLPAGLEYPWASPFVGRAKECDRLREMWKDAMEGGRRVALVTGEPGIGKTRLVSQFARGAQDEGAVVLYGGCEEGLGFPYQAFGGALGAYAAACRAEDLRKLVGPLGGELVRVLPTLAERLPGLPEPLRAEPETERYRLFEAVAGLFANLSATAPVLLVLDDLHWATPPDLALLRHVVRHHDMGPLLVIAAYRDTEVTPAAPLATVLADLWQEPGAERLRLSGLDEGAVGELLEGTTGEVLDALGDTLARAIHTQTEGNPFFVGEVMRHLADSGAVLRRAGPVAADQLLAELGTPAGVREVVSRRLFRLPDAVRDVLGLAAVIGREFDVSLLASASPAGADAVLDALERAEEARLVAPLVPFRPDRYVFGHSLLRNTLYDALSARRRARWHLRVAKGLEARGREDDVPDLAYHFSAAGTAGDPARTVTYAARAGDQAGERLAYEQAAGYYTLALDALASAAVLDPVRRAALLMARAEAWRRAGEIEHAREGFLAVAREAQGAERPERMARAVLGVGEVSAVWGTDPELVDLLETALEGLGGGHGELRACLLARLGQALYYSDPERRLELSRQAVEAARQADDPAALAAVLRARHVALSGPDGMAERQQVADELVRLAEEAAEPELALHGHGWRFVDRLETGDRAGAVADLAAHAELARSLRQPLHLRDSAMWRATMATLEGRFDEAEHEAEEAYTIGQQARDPAAEMVYIVQRAWLLMDAERVDELSPVRDAVGRMAEAVPESVAPAWRSPWALMAALGGAGDEARDEFEAVVDVALPGMPRDVPWLPCLVILAATCAELGDAGRAPVLYELLRPYAGRVLVPDRGFACRGAIDHYLGQLAALEERFDVAAAHFEAALALNRRLDARPLMARTQCEYARVLVAAGHPSGGWRAAGLARQALGLATALGMPVLTARARTALSRAASP